jgi:hypothetical protein
MSEFKVNHQVEPVEMDIGDRVKLTTEQTINETSALSVRDAALTLKHNLAEIGVEMAEEYCQTAVETIRSGKTFTFELG